MTASDAAQPVSAPVAVQVRGISPAGVAIMHSVQDYPPRHIDPSKGRGITSYLLLSYDHTAGNVTQSKIDEWQAGDAGSEGWFAAHTHRDMDEEFVVLSGTVTFRYREPTGPDGAMVECTVTLTGPYASVYFPAGVEHEGWNSGRELAVLHITGIRAGNRAPQDAEKGRHIPA